MRSLVCFLVLPFLVVGVLGRLLAGLQQLADVVVFNWNGRKRDRCLEISPSQLDSQHRKKIKKGRYVRRRDPPHTPQPPLPLRALTRELRLPLGEALLLRAAQVGQVVVLVFQGLLTQAEGGQASGRVPAGEHAVRTVWGKRRMDIALTRRRKQPQTILRMCLQVSLSDFWANLLYTHRVYEVLPL